ncbi:MAG: hypothetical protein Q8L88_14020 [Bacteroidota bacterium]|nr:hypothetical protein [Bacteroidota bacterium]
MMKTLLLEISKKSKINVIPRSVATRNLVFPSKFKYEISRFACLRRNEALASCRQARNDNRNLIFQMSLLSRKIIFLILLLIGGCKTVDLSIYDNSKSVSLNSNSNRRYVFVKHFNRDEKAYFTLFNLITAKDLMLDKVIQQELQANNGDGIMNLKIKGQDTFIDQLIPLGVGFLGTIIMPETPIGLFAFYMIGIRTYTIEGDIVRYVDNVEPAKASPSVTIDPLTGLPIKNEEKKIEYDPETGLPKKN